jgi:hypothetical protein
MLQIAAIIVVRNGALTLPRVLSHLGDNRIDVVAIDHGSVDKTAQVLAEQTPRPVIDVVHVPFDGVHRWRQNLGRKVEVAESLPHEWIVHVDADEIMESPKEEESLRGLIERLDGAGFDLIECDEFTFVPSDEGEDHSNGDYVATMRRYYYHSPPNRSLQRVVKASGPIEWANSGGHRAAAEYRNVAVDRIRLCHYVGLSLDHLRQQYLSRVFGAEELGRGWHRKRVATSPDFIVPPPSDRLFNLDVDGWRIDRPEARHLIFNQRSPYQPPDPIEADVSRAPMVFVVGVGRSGTTLLRLMLDSHPDLAITPETHWLTPALRSLEQAPGDTARLHRILTEHEFWPEMGVNHFELDEILKGHDADAPFETVRSIYHTYARHHGAKRVGDKTPAHGLAMAEIARVLSEARFVHIVRDGRDVAVSHRGLWFGPGDDPRDAAIFWLWRVREMRQQAEFLPHYLEVRYEDLVRDPEAVLRAIADFIDLPFHPAQLDSHRRAKERLSEITGRHAKGRLVSAEERIRIHTRTLRPPDVSRVDRWKKEMSSVEVATFERIAGTMLLDLGYSLSTSEQ